MTRSALLWLAVALLGACDPIPDDLSIDLGPRPPVLCDESAVGD